MTYITLRFVAVFKAVGDFFLEYAQRVLPVGCSVEAVSGQTQEVRSMRSPSFSLRSVAVNAPFTLSLLRAELYPVLSGKVLNLTRTHFLTSNIYYNTPVKRNLLKTGILGRIGIKNVQQTASENIFRP